MDWSGRGENLMPALPFSSGVKAEWMTRDGSIPDSGHGRPIKSCRVKRVMKVR